MRIVFFKYNVSLIFFNFHMLSLKFIYTLFQDGSRINNLNQNICSFPNSFFTLKLSN